MLGVEADKEKGCVVKLRARVLENFKRHHVGTNSSEVRSEATKQLHLE